MNLFIGFDIGGTKCAVVLGDETGKIMRRVAFDTPSGYDAALEQLLNAAKSFPKDGVCCAGISCGGPLDSRKGIIQSPPNLPGWDDVPIVSDISQALGMPVYLQNDANACALAEWRYGAGQGCQNMVFLTFGTGIGGGLILNGKLYAGTNDLAGEVGHIRLADDDTGQASGSIGYGKHGSWEGFASGSGIGRMAAKRITGQAHVPQWAQGEVSAKAVCEAATAGDSLALDIIRESAIRMGQGLALLVDILNPERIVIGSIYTRAEALFSDIIRAEMEHDALPGAAAVCQILPAALGDSIGDVAALTVAVDGWRECL